MTWQIQAAGHIRAGTPAEAAALELDLAMRIGAILRDPKYGCTTSRLDGNHVTAAPHRGESGEAKLKPAEPAVHRTGERATPASDRRAAGIEPTGETGAVYLPGVAVRGRGQVAGRMPPPGVDGGES
jgi:hypothetical protein